MSSRFQPIFVFILQTSQADCSTLGAGGVIRRCLQRTLSPSRQPLMHVLIPPDAWLHLVSEVFLFITAWKECGRLYWGDSFWSPKIPVKRLWDDVLKASTLGMILTTRCLNSNNIHSILKQSSSTGCFQLKGFHEFNNVLWRLAMQAHPQKVAIFQSDFCFWSISVSILDNS